MPKVSVIIPVYNGEKYISESIESVIGQSFPDWELVVVNDGSTDNSLSILKKYQDILGIKMKIIDQENRGLSVARNVGMENAVGNYFAFLDADDLWLPEKLSKQVELLESDDDIGLVYSDTFDLKNGIIEEKKTILKTSFYRGKIFDQLFYSTNFITVSSVLIKKSVVEDCGNFSLKYSGTQDYDLWLKVADKYKIDYVNEPLCIYRIHGNNMSSNYEKMELQVFELIKVWIKEKPYLTKPFKFNAKLAQMQYNILRYHLQSRSIMHVPKDLVLITAYLIGYGKMAYAKQT